MHALSNVIGRTLDDSFDGRVGFARLPEVARDFDFGRFLPKASFPEAFVKSYAAIAVHEPVDWDGERIYFIARFPDETVVAMYNGFYAPAAIQSQNAIISHPFADSPKALVLPPSHYIVGEALEETSECRILICLDPASPNHGRLFLWRLAHQPIGTGDNTSGLATLASRLDDFWPLLMTRTDAYAAMQGSPHRLIASPKLTAAVVHAAKVFAPYRSRVSFAGQAEPSDITAQDMMLLRNRGGDPMPVIGGRIAMAYQWSAHDPTTPEAQDDLRALLPTVFDLIAGNDDVVHADLSMALAKLRHVDWQGAWPDTERFAIRHFGLCLFESCLETRAIGPYWQGEDPQGIRTALHLPHYLAMLMNAGLSLGPLIDLWKELLAFEDVGAVLHAASLRFDIRRDKEGLYVDLPVLADDQRSELAGLAKFLMNDATFALQQRLKSTTAADEHRLLADALALVL
jgi:hypothetical protein